MTVNAILLFQVSLSYTQLKNFKLQYVSSSYKRDHQTFIS